MACTSATWGTSSLQLRLALNCENCRKSYGVLVRTRLKKLDRQVRVLCVAQNDERPRNESRWNGLGSSADTFAGGWGSDNDEHSIGSLRKNRFGGVVGAAVAGVILVAGLSFAAFSLSRRNASRLKQQMEPLTHEQEVSLASISDIGEINVYGNEGDNVKKQENRSLESKAEIDQDHSSSSEYKDAAIENKIDDDIKNSLLDDAKDTVSGSDIIYDVSIQEKHESALDDVSVAPEMISSSSNFPEPEIFIDSSYSPSHKDSDGSVSATITEPYEIGGSLIAVESTDFSNSTNLHIDLLEGLPSSNVKETSNLSLDSSVESDTYAPNEPVAVSISISSQLDTSLDPQIVPTYNMEEIASASAEENPVLNKMLQVSVESNISSIEMRNLSKIAPSATELESAYRHEKNINEHSEVTESRSSFESPTRRSSFLPAGIPAPSVVSAALRVQPGKVLVPAVVDQVQCQALAALQVLKVIEAHAQPTDLCTRREYARWLVSASSALSRNTVSKVYPAMYIENVTELAFDDITPEDPDFSSIQGLAEAGLISSKLSNRDLLNDYVGPLCFSPESPLSRQDLVSWKMALEKRQLPEADRKILYHLSGFVDIDKINPDAWPALIADLSAGEQGIIALAFGCTRLFQPAKPVTKAQAAVALATGEASDIVSEELARIEAESMAENAVSAHNALVAQVEKDINATFEKELSMEREKIDAVEKMAEQARSELEKLRAEREVENIALLKERAAIESEMEVLSRLRREVEEQLQSLMSNKVEISYEKERINKLRKEAEDENQEISRLQYELEVERKALSMARAWAEDEAKRAREQAKALEEARDRWERHGIKVVVDNDLREESTAGVTWLNAGNQISVEGTVNRAENLVEKLKVMADDVRGKSREIISKVLQYIQHLITFMKEWASIAGRKTEELKGKAGTKARELKDSAILKAGGSIQELQQGTAQFSLAVKEGAKRVAEDCREGVEKLTHKFKT